MIKILIIEDDKDISELIAYNLQQEKFAIDICENGKSGLLQAQKTLPDMILLDLMLPDMGGLEICRILKSDAKTKSIPIMMLTAKGEEIDRIVGFEVGADDYLSKPFSPRELLLRIKAIFRRIKEGKETLNSEKSTPLSFGVLQIDPAKFEVKVGKEEIRLTALEFKLLQFLLKTKGRISTRDNLLDQVWKYDAEVTTRTVDTHIKRLREKLGKAGDYIETIRGIGYRFKEKV